MLEGGGSLSEGVTMHACVLEAKEAKLGVLQ